MTGRLPIRNGMIGKKYRVLYENSDYGIELIGVGKKMKQFKKPGSKLKKGEKIKFKLI